MSEPHPHGSDTGAAYRGLIFGAIFIGAILTFIVWYTNKHFTEEKGGGEKPVAVAEGEPAFG